MHYLLHGYHHMNPMDAMRLVFPPEAAAVLSLLVCYVHFHYLIRVLFPPSVAPALFGGGVLGYTAYDLTH
ncbi:hypothetical protein ACFX13_004658 [Malus domestica]